MALDPTIILAGNQVDAAGSMARGNALAQQVNDMRQQRQLADLYRTQGAGIASGDQNALNALAGIDPMAAMSARRDMQNMEAQRLNMDATRQNMQLNLDQHDQRVKEWAAQQSAEQRAAAALEIENGVKQGMAAQTPEQWDAIMGRVEPDLVGQFANRQSIAAKYMSWADLLKGGQGDFRPASSDEAGKYGAAAGQFGPDGRFYPINPPSGLAIETGPDGRVRVVQGSGASGAAGKAFTEGQSKDNVFATRAEGALAVLDPVAGSLTSRGERVLEAVPLGFGRGAQSDDFQVAKNAGDEFLQAILRKDTGAAITDTEQALYGVTYLPQPGDSDAVMAAKVQARRRALEALKAGMSPAQIVAQGKALLASGSQTVPEVAPAELSDDEYLKSLGLE